MDVNATGPLVNTATVTSSTSDPNANNNESSATTTITQSADVGVVKSGPGTVVAGTDATYSVRGINEHGPSDASFVDGDGVGCVRCPQAALPGPLFTAPTSALCVIVVVADDSLLFALGSEVKLRDGGCVHEWSRGIPIEA